MFSVYNTPSQLCGLFVCVGNKMYASLSIMLTFSVLVTILDFFMRDLVREFSKQTTQTNTILDFREENV
jgi:hypothetical protein